MFALIPYKYNGKEEVQDLGIGLYEYGFRWYDAQIAKFVQVDPLADDYSYKSTYDYAENSPISFIDLDGAEKANPELLSNGQLQDKGGHASINAIAGSEERGLGIGLSYKGMAGSYQNFFASFFAGSQATLGIRQNGTNVGGLFTQSLLNVQAGHKWFGLGISVEPRINFGDFSKQSNISASALLNVGPAQLSIGNDVFFALMSGGGGWNPIAKKFTASDGGNTMHGSLLYFDKSRKSAFGISFNGYTPHRTEFGATNEYSVPAGQGGVFYNNGLFNVENYDGAYRNYAGLTYLINKNSKFSFGFYAGIQNDHLRAKAQGWIHNNPKLFGPIGEFPDIYPHNYGYLQGQINYKF